MAVLLILVYLLLLTSAAEWVINNGTASPSSAAGFKATYYTDNAVNSIFELAMSGTDSAGINGMAYILRGTSYGDVRILTGMVGEDLYDIFSADAALMSDLLKMV